MADAPDTQQDPPGPDETSFAYLFRMAGPMVVATVSYTCMQFVDRLMVAYYDEKALAAVLPATMVSFIPSSFMLGVMTTVNTFVSQSFGRRAYQDCSRYCWQAIYLGLLYSVCTFIVVWPTAPTLFRLMDQPEELVSMEVTYLHITLIGQFVVALLWATNQFFMGVHRPVVIMVTALVSQTVNVLANYALIFGKLGCPEMGIAGAAWGTVIGASVNALARSYFFLGPTTHRDFRSRATWAWDMPKIWNLLRVGTPAGFAFMINTAFVGAILFKLIGRFGTESLAATSAVYSCMSVSFMPVVGLGSALTASVGKSIGKGRKTAATHQTNLYLAVAVGYMGVVGCGLFLFRNPIIQIWNLSADAAGVAVNVLICAAIFQVFDAILITYNGALRGAGDTLWLGVSTTLGAGLVLGLGGWMVVTYYPQWGAVGPWIAYTLHVTLLGLANRWRFRSNFWHRIDVLR